MTLARVRIKVAQYDVMWVSPEIWANPWRSHM